MEAGLLAALAMICVQCFEAFSYVMMLLLYRCQDFIQAHAHYSKCLQERPDSIVILSNLAAVHIELGEFSKALTYAQDALNMDATHVKSLYRCGVAQMNLQQHAEAIRLLNQAKQQVSLSCPLSSKSRILRMSKYRAWQPAYSLHANKLHFLLVSSKTKFCAQFEPLSVAEDSCHIHVA